MEERLSKLQAKLEADPSLAEKLLSLETAEEVQGFLRGLELEFSLEEINMLRDGIVKVVEKGNIGTNGELSDEDLEDVAGGVVVAAVISIVSLIIGVTSGAGHIVHDATRGRW